MPPGQLRFDLSAPNLLLYTIQTAEAFETLQRSGILVGDPTRADPDWSHVYPFMYDQMNERLSTSGHGALWLWGRTSRRYLVDHCRYCRGAVLLTCLVPRERVLLSHFDDWHLVLNCAPLVREAPGESEAETIARWDLEYAAIDAELAAVGLRRWDHSYRAWPLGVRERLERSWQSIFDIEQYPAGDVVQATVHQLHQEQVVRAVRIE